MMNMRYLTLSISLILISFGGYSQTETTDISGIYQLPNGLEVKLYPEEDGSFSGKILALNSYDNGEIFDVNNPDRSRRKDSLIGKILITGLVYNTEKRIWDKGIMYGPEKGLFFNLQVEESHAGGIEVVGSKFLFSKSMCWRRVTEEKENQ